MPRRADRPARKAGRRPQTCRAKSQICAYTGCEAPTHRRPVLPAKKDPHRQTAQKVCRWSGFPLLSTLYTIEYTIMRFLSIVHIAILRVLAHFCWRGPALAPLLRAPLLRAAVAAQPCRARPCKTQRTQGFPRAVAAVPRALFPRPQKETAPSQTEGAAQKRSGGKNRELFPVLHEDRANEMSWLCF